MAGRFDCNGFEINPLNCSIRQFIGPQVCTPDVGVECHLLFQQECIDGSLRLVGSDDPTQGRVEICHNNVWGTVCENSWNDIDAAVVCRQLNFTGTVQVILYTVNEMLLNNLHSSILHYSTLKVL